MSGLTRTGPDGACHVRRRGSVRNVRQTRNRDAMVHGHLATLILLGFLVSTVGCMSSAPRNVVEPGPAAGCAVSTWVDQQPPTDPEADPFVGRWYVNADRTIWAGWDATDLHVGENKILWIRPKGTQLQVAGRRIDGPSEPLKVSIPCCYSSGFQASGVYLPTAGCWEIRASAGTSELTFVTQVR